MSRLQRRYKSYAISLPALAACLTLGLAVAGQTPAKPAPAPATLQQMQAALAALQQQLQQQHKLMDQLQAQVRSLSDQLASASDQQTVVAGQVATQEQDKVQSGSRFQVSLSGMLLMNAYSDQGTVENADVPNLAFGGGGGSVGASVRQSEISLRVNGPELWGAQTSGELIADFFGGLPSYLDADASGLARIKIARGRLDWAHTSLIFGEDTPLISPLSPTSYASVAIPALGYSGNLWTWAPQLAVEQRWGPDTGWQATLQVGVMDPLDGEFPASTRSRKPEAGELSRQPALEMHAGLARPLGTQTLALGVGAYSSRQDYGFGRGVHAWALTADARLPLTSRLDLSGEAYRGRALGGLWGAVGASIVSSASDLTNPATQIAGLNDAGGWGQLTVHATPTLDFNAAYGLDHPFRGDLGRFASLNSSLPFAGNRTALVNLVDRPRSDLVLALEYRHLATQHLLTGANTAAQTNAAIAIIF
ncbi:MAG: hypothetical protein ACRD1A_03450 [Terriglobales bacterium]